MAGGHAPGPALRPKPGLTTLLHLYLVATAVVPWLLARLARKGHAAQGADAARLPERFGTPSAPRPKGRLVWINAASVGEVASSLDLARDLAEATGAQIMFTTTTATGAETLARRLPQAIHQFQPIDTPAAVRGFLNHWQPDLALFMENDLWPRLMIETDQRGIPIAVINARASRTRGRAPRSVAALLGRAALISTQDSATAKQILGLGLDPARIIDTGDLKAAANPLPADEEALSHLRTALHDRPVWIAASTHPGDEAAAITAHQAALIHHPDLLLIVIPRHPIRGGEVSDLISAAGLTHKRRSLGEMPDSTTQAYLADTLGETGLFYRITPLVFLGGSFGAEGGHNPYEPIMLGAAVLHGPNVANFATAYDGLTQAGLAQCVPDADDLGAQITRLIHSADLHRMTQQAQALSHNRQIARQTVLARLIPLLDHP